MLVLSRLKNESILIGPNIVVTVVAVEGGKVRLGIDAPKNVQILRDEVDRRMKAERAAEARAIREAGDQ